MSDDDQSDIGTIAEVPEDERLDVDEGEGSTAGDEGADADLDDVYANPGAVWEGPQ